MPFADNIAKGQSVLYCDGYHLCCCDDASEEFDEHFLRRK